MPAQFCVLALDVHVSPESVDVQMYPPKTVAASLVPSLDVVIPLQFCVLALDVHVSPESVDVQMFPPETVAASLVPSLDDVMSYQYCGLSVGLTSVHVEALTEASEANESNAASRTRSIGQHFVSLVSCRPYLKVSRNEKNDSFASLFTDTHTNGRETGSNWVDLSLFGQILIVPGAVNNEIDGQKFWQIC